MVAGFGVDKGADGSGTTASDIRKIWGGIYTPGIIDGCKITTSATNMQYTVAAGVVAIGTATKETVLAPVALTTVTGAAAPASGTRTDTIYVQQRYPSIEGDANTVVGITTGSAPARSIIIGKYTVSAGQTNSNASVATTDRTFSIPYGASLGVLHSWQSPASGPLSIPLLREGFGSFTLPTDRRLRFSLSALLYAGGGASGFDNSKYTEHYFLPMLDGGDMLIWTTPGLHQAWATYNWDYYVNVLAGTHTTGLGAGRMVGPGQASTHYGLDTNGFGRRGIYFQVEDAGPIR